MPYPCPKCDEKTAVKNTWAEVRTRQCVACGHKFYTEEMEFDPVGPKPSTLQRYGYKSTSEKRKEART